VRSDRAADLQQAEYFRLLLTECCAEIDRRIGKYHDALARCQARGNTDDARRLRRTLRAEERERQSLERMLAALRQRFDSAHPRACDSSPRRPPASAISHDGRSVLPSGHAKLPVRW
jgi:hypothetical protein